MRSYSYSITLRVWHPSMDPADLTLALGVEPEVSSRAGEVNESLGRRALKGLNRESYWCADLLGADHDFSREDTVQDYLDIALDKLGGQEALLSRICDEGGRVSLDVGAHGRRECSIDLPAKMLQSLLSLKLDLSFDVTSAPR